jgi:hypothetical protein
LPTLLSSAYLIASCYTRHQILQGGSPLRAACSTTSTSTLDEAAIKQQNWHAKRFRCLPALLIIVTISRFPHRGGSAILVLTLRSTHQSQLRVLYCRMAGLLRISFAADSGRSNNPSKQASQVPPSLPVHKILGTDLYKVCNTPGTPGGV